MALQYLHEYDEISTLNFEKDYIELAHSDEPEIGNHVSHKLSVSDLYNELSSRIQDIVKVSKVVDIQNDDLGKIFYTTVFSDGDSMVFKNLVSSDFIPISYINGKKISLFNMKNKDPYAEYSDNGQEIEVHRNDLSAFFEYAKHNGSPVIQKMSNRVRINPEYMDGRYICNITDQSEQFKDISSSAPVLSAWFPPGNKPMGVEEISDFINGCWKMDDMEAGMYISKQTADIKNGIRYSFDASNCSDVYGKSGDYGKIWLNSVRYVPYVVVKSETIHVGF